jgi:hypothetical protein
MRRFLSIYDRITDNLIEAVELNAPQDVLRSILNPTDEDIQMYKLYTIRPPQLELFMGLVPYLSKYNLEKVEIFYECFT